MSKKNVFLLAISMIYLLIALIVLYLQISSIPVNQDSDIDKILENITREIENKNLDYLQIKMFPKKKFFAIWREYKKNEWHPVIIDKVSYNPLPQDVISPFLVPVNLKYQTRKYYKEIKAGFNYCVWINKFEPEHYVTNILYTLVALIFIYIIITIVIMVLSNFLKVAEEPYDYDYSATYDERMNKGYNEFNREEINQGNVEEELSSEQPNDDNVQILNKADLNLSELDNLEKKVKKDTPHIIKKLNKNKILEEYKELWGKNFKISPHFKENFPFNKIYNLSCFAIHPENYIKEGLEIANSYFKWNEPKLYIFQKDHFTENSTKQKLDESKIRIPEDGTMKGDIFIPLFPYHKTNIFGFLNFEWNQDELFHVSDILFFLKYLFSDNAKYIFMNAKRNKAIKNKIDELLENKEKTFLAFIQVDNKDKIIKDYPLEEQNVINASVFKTLSKGVIHKEVFEVFPFYYGVYGTYENQDDIIINIEDYILNDELHNYFISSQSGNIAISVSGGAVFSESDYLEAKLFIQDAENNLHKALAQGGHQLVGF